MCCRRRWSRTCTGPTASGAPRPAPLRSRSQEMKHWRLLLAGIGGAAALIRASPARPGPCVRAGCRSGASRVFAFVLDRDGKLLRAYATAEGRWRLPATVKDVDPRFLEVLLAYEDKRFYDALRRRSWSARARGLAACHAAATSSPAARPSPCRWRGCWSRARSAGSTPSCSRPCARCSSNSARKDEIFRSI